MAVHDHQQEQEAPTGASVDQVGGSQGQTRPGRESLANSKMKPDVETCTEEVTTEQNNVPGAKRETRIEAGSSSWQPQNQTVRFPKSHDPVSTASY
jgi:hypothetical protein